MRRVVCVLLAVLVVTFLVGVPTGCGRNEGKPNPDLKIPDVPPGGHASKDALLKDPGRK